MIARIKFSESRGDGVLLVVVLRRDRERAIDSPTFPTSTASTTTTSNEYGYKTCYTKTTTLSQGVLAHSQIIENFLNFPYYY